MTRLYIVRHGETEWNKLNKTQGCSNDLLLSTRGMLQAKAVSLRFSSIPLSAIYSSDLKRAVETADEISNITSLPVNKTSKLREMNFGCWEGMTFDEIKQKYNKIYEVWSSNPQDATIPEGETLIELQSRVLNTVNDIILKHEGKNILIVSHGMYIKVLILSVLGMDMCYHSKIKIDNTSLSIIDYMARGPVLTLLNDVCHLSSGGK